MSEDFAYTPDEIVAWEQHVRNTEESVSDSEFWADNKRVQRLLDEASHGMSDVFFSDVTLVRCTMDDAHNEIIDAFWGDEVSVRALLNDPA